MGDGVARSAITGQGYGGTDLASDVIFGGLGEGLGDVLGSANRLAQKGYLESTAATLRSGPAILPSGRSAAAVAGRMDSSLAWINASEGALAGAASGSGSRVRDDDPNGR